MERFWNRFQLLVSLLQQASAPPPPSDWLARTPRPSVCVVVTNLFSKVQRNRFLKLESLRRMVECIESSLFSLLLGTLLSTVDVSTQLLSLFFVLLDNTIVTAGCGSLLPGCVSVVLGSWAAAAGGPGCLSQPAPSSVAWRPLLAGIHHSNSLGCAVTLCLSRWRRSACSVNSLLTGCIFTLKC